MTNDDFLGMVKLFSDCFFIQILKCLNFFFQSKRIYVYLRRLCVIYIPGNSFTERVYNYVISIFYSCYTGQLLCWMMTMCVDYTTVNHS
jgi:hypothetical protein